MTCRHCGAVLEHVFLDLGSAPPSNAYLEAAALKAPEVYFPLKLFVCDRCWLVQTEDYPRAEELFSRDYAYFSSVSKTWLDHAARYAEMIQKRLRLTASSFVIEVGANDGYLLKNFLRAGIPCLGIEPTESTAAAAESLGIPILRRFFGCEVAEELATDRKHADLVVGNNVYAHVPDVNDFTSGLRAILKPGGTVTLEFPHLMRLVEHAQFDTVYHEHFSYFSLHSVARIFARAGLRIWDVEELPTHGGSLRIYGCLADDGRVASPAVASLLAEEQRRGLFELGVYKGFQERADRIKDDLLLFLVEQKRRGRHIAGYGAAAKGNTLLNYAGIKADLLPYVCDAAPSKQGKFLPGSHIPILPPTALFDRSPDAVLVLPWNLAAEIADQQAALRKRGARFIIAIPKLHEY